VSPLTHLDAARIQRHPLDIDALVAATERPDCGALATFTGVVRDHQDGRAVLRLSYSAHESMADKLIREIEATVATEHAVPVCRVIHRVGDLEIGDAAIIAVVRSAHRAESFAAVAAVVDAVKHQVPIWKEEFYADGTRAFVQGCTLVPSTAADSMLDEDPAPKFDPTR
jgi:molybdopterin synthase catalytic subunit